MKVKVKQVYYCDFCKKHSLLPLQKHEEGCTLNPDRYCRLCGRDDLKPLIAKYANTYVLKEEEGGFGPETKVEWTNGEVKMGDILSDTEHCPNCTLAILRINKLCETHLGWNYKEALESWWEDQKPVNDYYY